MSTPYTCIMATRKFGFENDLCLELVGQNANMHRKVMTHKYQFGYSIVPFFFFFVCIGVLFTKFEDLSNLKTFPFHNFIDQNINYSMQCLSSGTA